MSIETTHRISRKDAITTLEKRAVFGASELSNEQLSDLLYDFQDSIFENYDVVDFEVTEEPDDDKWHFWKFSW